MVRSYSQNYQATSCDIQSTAVNPSLLPVIPVTKLFYPAFIKVSGFCALLSSKCLSVLCTFLKDNAILTSVYNIDKANAMCINLFLSHIPY